jgi:1-deoxy-D-xylulose-5-phosphate synthase
MSTATSPLLYPANGSADLRTLGPEQLADLAGQIRALLVDTVCATGGHLGSNLGMVEITLALHRVFDSPRDVILFDIGHQAYVHKILTGRSADFRTLRQKGGLSGYLSRAESAHDVIENSHASTVLAYADGIARAQRLRGETGRQVVAVIGDGALTGGMAYEGLNNIGGAGHPNLIVVLNDNGRSYSPTVGGLADHLRMLRNQNLENRGMVPRSMFENLGLHYLGPVDGHDLAAVENALARARTIDAPVVVHCVTVKGRGYPPAEADEADCLHGVGVVDPRTGWPVSAPEPSWTSVFGETITDLAATRSDLVCLTGAMLQPVGLQELATKWPDRVLDVGIAEQHAVTCAAGLAAAGMHPVVCLYATFLNRAFDQALMDVALHRLPVTFVLDRAGITGPDGPSHHGVWDISTFAPVPGIRIAAPRDPARLRELLREAVDDRTCPTLVRFPKANASKDIDALSRIEGIDVLHRTPRRPLDVLLIAVGVMAQPCLEAAAELNGNGVGVTVVDPRWVVPVHSTLVHLAARHRLAVTVEDGSRAGGVGSLIAQACADASTGTPVHNLGLPRVFIEHGRRDELLADHGLTAEGITRCVQPLAQQRISRGQEVTP